MKQNKYKFPPQLFITGTDTGIGKTMISAILVKGLQAAYWKPIQSGLAGETDTEWAYRNTGLPVTHFLPERYRLTKPLSPHLSARLDGVKINLNDFHLPEYEQNHLIIEGAGGIMVPINDQYFIADLIRQLNIPVLLVARSGLGTINHTLLTLEKLNSLKVPVFGVVLNGEINSENKKAIEHFGHAKVIAEIDHLSYPAPKTLQLIFENEFQK
ncbi:MAG: dethiobiotin synthase [Balneolales bacterium]